MTILVNIGFWALFIYTAVKSCFVSKRYKELRNYTFWTEQALLQYRPETYIPVWRKQQREKRQAQQEPFVPKSCADSSDCGKRNDRSK